MHSAYDGALERRQLVVLTVRTNGPNLKNYVGQVSQVSEYGVRITLMDRVQRDFVGLDFFAPWTNIQSAIVADADDELEAFLEYVKGVSRESTLAG